MNRRSAIKAAIAGAAAAIGWKVAKAEPCRWKVVFDGNRADTVCVPSDAWFESRIDGVEYSGMFNQGVMSRNDVRLLECRTMDLFEVSTRYGIPMSELQRMSKEDVECLLRRKS